MKVCNIPLVQHATEHTCTLEVLQSVDHDHLAVLTNSLRAEISNFPLFGCCVLGYFWKDFTAIDNSNISVYTCLRRRASFCITM